MPLLNRDDLSLSMKNKLIITGSYFLSTLLSYSLMLVVMSFNGFLFIATVMGLGFGYFIFGYLKNKNHLKAKVEAGSEKIYNPEGDKCCADVDYD